MIKQIVFCFLLCFLLTDANAETSFNDSLSATEPDSGLNEQALQQLSLKKDALNDMLADIEKRYGETAALLKKLQTDIERNRSGLNNIRSEMSVLKSEINKQNKELAGQIRSAYMMGRKERLKLLLNQQDPGLSSRMMNYYNYLNKARITKLDEINKSIKRLDQLEKDKQQETDHLEKRLDLKKSEQFILDGARKQRHDLLAQLNDSSISNAEQLTHLSESENKLKNLIASLDDSEGGTVSEQETEVSLSPDEQNNQTSAGSATESLKFTEDFPKLKIDFADLKGKLPWPVKGRLIQKFGSPRSGSVWDGVLIDAKEGADIHAVTWGKVVYAEWLRGYGLLIIIDHGQGYMTLYAFNQSLYKHIGETVNPGDIIASAGQSGGRSQSGLYFGIRKKGAPIDPLEWCKQ